MLRAICLPVEIFALAKIVVAGVDDPGPLLGLRYTAGITPKAFGATACTRLQLGARWRNSFSASATAKIGQAEIAIIMAKSSASITNSQVFSLAK